jgi:hypothetical protein
MPGNVICSGVEDSGRAGTSQANHRRLQGISPAHEVMLMQPQCRFSRQRLLLSGAVVLSALLAEWRVAPAQQPAGTAPARPAVAPLLALRPVYNLQPGEHPILPALRWAHAGVKHVESINDYACTFAKRERVNGILGTHQYLRLKVRHRPFSVYLYFETPESDRGQEAIYVEGRNDGKLLAHGVGLKGLLGTLALDPHSPRGMAGGRHPITDIGLLHMMRELIAVGQNDAQYGECEVKFLSGAKVNGRSCTCMQFVHPVPRREFRYHIARIFVDDELCVPIRFEGYDWPANPKAEPPLTEEYTYMNLKLNNGFTDADFDTANPRYGYR